MTIKKKSTNQNSEETKKYVNKKELISEIIKKKTKEKFL